MSALDHTDSSAEAISRAAFLSRSAVVGAGSLLPFGVLAPAAAGQAEGDVETLNVLLGLEFVLVALYEEAIDRAELPDSLRRLAERTSDDDQSHVRGLKNLVRELGGEPAGQGVIRFDELDGRDAFLDRAVELEDLSVGAHSGALPRLDNTLAVGSVGSILQVDARHAARLRLAAGLPPAPSAFGEPLAPARVSERVAEYRRR
jgi:rubrerythrin